ncbi:uncharacterized protein LOC125314507 [Rhodamnia argentea]|uniref:Uncharacterized protein LOC125314507 n=1 Tax=Rhodamnia argentea TaxID=178133 RepID=A0ABM3H8D2_9MYRT|nr:uncharacterized protein LOC125314507 [Rhodamnia argentea]
MLHHCCVFAIVNEVFDLSMFENVGSVWRYNGTASCNHSELLSLAGLDTLFLMVDCPPSSAQLYQLSASRIYCQKDKMLIPDDESFWREGGREVQTCNCCAVSLICESLNLG